MDISWSNDDFEFNVPVKFSGKTLLDVVYPVGAIYMSVSEISPATLFGGTWERIQNRFLLAAASSYTAGNTGGEATHTLTANEMPSHTHALRANTSWGESETLGAWKQYFGSNILMDAGSSGTTITTSYYYDAAQQAGGGGSHNNMPPYLVVYMWKRTA